MDRVTKITLIQRTLALRHKLKVHDSMEPPTNHEDLALNIVSRWELEDELLAIEEILSGARRQNQNRKRETITKDVIEFSDGLPQDPVSVDEDDDDDDGDRGGNRGPRSKAMRKR